MALTKKASRRNSDHSQGGERAENPSCGKTTRHAFFSFFFLFRHDSLSLSLTRHALGKTFGSLSELFWRMMGVVTCTKEFGSSSSHILFFTLSLSLLRGHIAGFFYVTCCVSTKAAQILVCWGKTLIREPPRWQQRP